MFVGQDASFNNRIYVNNDSKISGNLTVTNNNTSFGGIINGNNLFISNDTTINGHITVGQGVSISTGGMNIMVGDLNIYNGNIDMYNPNNFINQFM